MAWSGDFDLSAWDGSMSDAMPKTSSRPRPRPICQTTMGVKSTYNQSNRPGSTINQNIPSKKHPIASLSAGLPNVVICGIVLAKEAPKNILSKKNPGSECHLLNFTIRDSPYDYINATCWGSKDHVESLAKMFHIGDIIEISNPQVQSKPNDGRDERFRPITPSLFSLNISETHTTVKHYDGSGIEEFSKLHNIPVKASNDYYTLGDIEANGQSISGETINILAGVRKVGAVRDIVCKTGRKVKKCEVYLFDETCSSFLMTIWDEELSAVAQDWVPKEHILFAADVRVSYDTFKKKMVASTSSQTILTINPDTKEAYSLYQYAQTVDFSTDSYSFGTEDHTFDISKVNTVYTVAQLKSLCSNGVENKEVEYGIVYAYLSSFNLDTDEARCVTARCNHCKRRIDLKIKTCTNLECPSGGFGDCPQDFKLEFNILVALSDHTGTITACHLDTPYAERILGYSVDEYRRLSVNEKTNLKWKLLLEKCKVYVKLFLPSLMRAKAMVRVMSLGLADPMEAVRNIKDSEA